MNSEEEVKIKVPLNLISSRAHDEFLHPAFKQLEVLKHEQLDKVLQAYYNN